MNVFAPRGRILVVENDPDIRSGLAEVLEDEGHRVVQASNGEEGLACARADVPDLVVLDLMMPVMDGYEFLEQWAADPSLAVVPVIVLTARRPVDVPGYEVVYKPFDLEVLLDAVARRLHSALGGAAAGDAR